MFKESQMGKFAPEASGGAPESRGQDVDGNWRLIARLVSRLGYTGRHRAEPTVGRHGYGEDNRDERAQSRYVSVDELLSPER